MGSIKQPLLSQNQKDILGLLLEEGLTETQIATRRKVSKAAISKTISKLKAKGYIEAYKKGGLTSGGVVIPKGVNYEKEIWRYHALEFEVRPYYFTDHYYNVLKKKGNRALPYGKWKISLYYKKVMIWLDAGIDYAFKDKNEAIITAQNEFNDVLNKMAFDLGFYVFKDRKANILLLKQHLANTYAPEASIITEKQMFVQFRGEDNKVWLQYDQSKGFSEREYTHGLRAVDDSDTLEPYLNDLRDNNPLTNSQLTSRLSDVITAIEKLTQVVEKRL